MARDVGVIWLFTIAATFFACGCNTKIEQAAENAALTGATAGITAAVQDLKDSRELVEKLGRDIKRKYTPEDDAYKAAELKYAAAQSAFSGYFSALRFAVLNDEPASGLQGPSADAIAAATDFIRHAAEQLDPTLNTRSIKFGRAFRLPFTIPPQIRRIPQRQRVQALRSLEDQVSWDTWSQL